VDALLRGVGDLELLLELRVHDELDAVEVVLSAHREPLVAQVAEHGGGAALQLQAALDRHRVAHAHELRGQDDGVVAELLAHHHALVVAHVAAELRVGGWRRPGDTWQRAALERGVVGVRALPRSRKMLKAAHGRELSESSVLVTRGWFENGHVGRKWAQVAAVC
jgi:hypothetical protein